MRNGRLARAGAGLAVGFIGAIVVVQVVDWLGNSDEVRSNFERVLGVPDLSGYCERDHDGLLPLLVAPGPYGWECAGPISNVWTSTPIDFDAVCQWQHDERAKARLYDSERPEGWRCVTRA